MSLQNSLEEVSPVLTTDDMEANGIPLGCILNAIHFSLYKRINIKRLFYIMPMLDPFAIINAVMHKFHGCKLTSIKTKKDEEETP